jgi:hypothetical protein
MILRFQYKAAVTCACCLWNLQLRPATTCQDLRQTLLGRGLGWCQRTSAIGAARPCAIAQSLTGSFSRSRALAASGSGAVRSRTSVRADPAIFLQTCSLPSRPLLFRLGWSTIAAAITARARSVLGQQSCGQTAQQQARNHNSENDIEFHTLASFFFPKSRCLQRVSKVNRPLEHERSATAGITKC